MAEFKAVTATDKLLKLNKRIRAAAGGTSASKTISILLILIDKCQTAANNNKQLLVSVVSESLPHLKRGVMRDFINIMEGHGYFKEASWNRTDFIYSFGPNTKLEFFGVDAQDKVRGPRRDILFMNEANNCKLEAFEQLEVRTKDEIWLDWNPTNEFWFYSEILPHRKDDLDFITLTYLDNEALDDNIVQSIEARKHNKSWWKVYGLGQLGDVEGKIYKDWAIIDEVPHEARLERLGLDFGYANDPASLIALYYFNGGYIVDELLHRTHMPNRKIADYINNSSFPNALVIADSAEPKSIAEMQEYGINIIGAQKGPGSRNQGIQYVQDQRMSVTKRSTNIIKAYRNYMWKTDKDGNILDIPDHAYSDAMDACLVAGTKILTSKGTKNIENIKVGDFVMTRKGYRKVLSAGITGRDKQIYDLSYGQYRLSGTGNHPVWTTDGWKDLRDIRYADKLFTCTQLSNTGPKNTIVTQNLNSYIADVTSTMPADFYTDTSTKITLGRFQRGCTSIIRTMTSLITALRTLNFSLIRSMVNDIGQKRSPLKKGATFAPASSMTLTTVKATGFAPISVRVPTAAPRGLITKYEGAFSVNVYSPPTDSKTSNTVQGAVQTVRESGQRADVYNLEVEEEHEYFANGILVHNCRYALETMRPDEDEDKIYTSGNLAKLYL